VKKRQGYRGGSPAQLDEKPMIGFGIEETADGFILRRGFEEIQLSKPEFFSLRLQMNLWTERILSQLRGRTGELQSIVSHQIAEAGVWPDAIQENVLLTLTTSGETKATFSLPIGVAQVLAGALSRALSLMQPSSRA
jgi:hypothetical protein